MAMSKCAAMAAPEACVASVKTFNSRTSTNKLAASFAGVSRDEAIRSAQGAIDEHREAAMDAVRAAIFEIRAMLAQPGRKHAALLRKGDTIITIAGTFDFAALERAAKSLCDLLERSRPSAAVPAQSVLVHADAMQLLAASGSMLPAAQVDALLAELAKL